MKDPPPETKSSSPAAINEPKGRAFVRTNRKKKLSIQSLKPAFKPSIHAAATQALGDIVVEIGAQPFDSPQSFGLSMDNYDCGNAIRGFLQAIYDRINNLLIFDSILVQYGHFGNVYLEFRVANDGRIQIDSLRTKAIDKILKVHTIRSALIPALKKPLKGLM